MRPPALWDRGANPYWFWDGSQQLPSNRFNSDPVLQTLRIGCFRSSPSGHDSLSGTVLAFLGRELSRTGRAAFLAALLAKFSKVLPQFGGEFLSRHEYSLYESGSRSQAKRFWEIRA